MDTCKKAKINIINCIYTDGISLPWEETKGSFLNGQKIVQLKKEKKKFEIWNVIPILSAVLFLS